MAKVYVTRKFPGPGLQQLWDSSHEVAVNEADRVVARSELLEAVSGCGGILTQLQDRIDAEVLDAAGPGLRVVSNYAVGFNNIDVEAATRRGVVVCNTPDVLTEASADIAWVLLMGAARRVSEGDHLVRSGAWDGWRPTQLLGSDLVGRTLLIVGAGRIGAAVARRARAWDMRVLYTARETKPELERTVGAERMDLDEALPLADFVSLHVPLTEETRHLIGAERLERMKPTAHLINTARGAVVDEQALVEALRSREIAGAGLDVYEREPRLREGLADCPNALLLPHLGSATEGTRSAMGEMAVGDLLAVLAGRRPAHPVNTEVLEAPGGRSS